MKQDLLKIINTYGVIPQLKYFQSEVFELNEAIITYENEIQTCDPICDEGFIQMINKNIVGEIADVMVMLKQLQYYYNIEDKQVEEIMEYKINRQLDRISKEKENDISK